MPFDIPRVLKQLEPGADNGAAGALPSWLTESWADPPGFAAALLAFHAGKSSPPPKSRPGLHYDFHHDLVTRNPGEHVAMRWWDRQAGWQALTYAQLDARSAQRAGAWRAQGVAPGGKVLIAHHLGPELLVSLVTALRLGAAVTLLPPVGPRFFARRLAAAEPTHIAAEPHQAPLFGPLAKALLRDDLPAAPVTSSHTWPAAEPIAFLLSPLVDPCDQLVPLTADDAFIGALRDGVLVHQLRPEDHLAAPGCHVLQQQPALLLAALVRGAAYLHLDLAAIERDPALLVKHAIRSLGISPALRDLLLKVKPPSLRGVDHWFRNPEESADFDTWRAFTHQVGLQNAAGSNVLVDAAAGGAVLTSPRRRNDVLGGVLPVPGRAFALLDLSVTGQRAPAEAGVLALLPEDAHPPGHIVLGRSRGEYLYAGTLTPRRDGRAYPAAEVEALISELPFVAGAAVVPVSAGGSGARHLFVLVVFTGAEDPARTDAEGGARRQEINRLIERHLLPEHLPDRIELFPLFPRRKEGAIDKSWCAFEYLRGALYDKSRRRIYRLLTKLRAVAIGPARPPAPTAPGRPTDG